MELIELTKTDEDMHGFQFVLRAMLKENHANETICSDVCIKITNTGEVIGSDRRRVHIYRAKENYKPGIYRVLKRLKTHSVFIMEDEYNFKKEYPDTSNLFLCNNESAIPFDMVLPNSDAGIAAPYTKIIRALPSFQTINPAYLKDIDDNGTVTIDPEKSYIIFKNDMFRASIATMAFEDV
jgi:hypothetical protein